MFKLSSIILTFNQIHLEWICSCLVKLIYFILLLLFIATLRLVLTFIECTMWV